MLLPLLLPVVLRLLTLMMLVLPVALLAVPALR
jgi:hypothetical protein